MKNILFVITLCLAFGACTNLSHRNSKMPRNNAKVYNDGYGQTGSAGYTGSADAVNTQTIDNLTLDVYLRRLSGVNVNGNGASASVTVRGISSFVGSNEPLFVVNGQTLNGGYNSAYNNINPREIKSVTVLKDASASLYGSRGAHGVIVITLKARAEDFEQ